MKILTYKRKQSGKTDYRKRLTMLKSRVPRFVVRKRGKTMVTQIIEYQKNGDAVLVTSTSAHLKKHGWKLHGTNLPAAYLVGFYCGVLGKKKGIAECILDANNATIKKGTSTYAAAKGLLDAGINLKCGEGIFPSEDRMLGKHMAAYAKSLKEEEYKKIFQSYAKQGISPQDIQKHIEEIKKKLAGAQ